MLLTADDSDTVFLAPTDLPPASGLRQLDGAIFGGCGGVKRSRQLVPPAVEMNHRLLSMNDWAPVMLCQQRLSRPAGLMSQVYQMCSCATQKTLCDTEKTKNKKEPVSWSKARAG